MYVDRDYDEHIEDEEPRSRRRLVPLIGGLALLAAVGGAMWYAYQAGVDAGNDSGVPLIVADDGPIRVRPDDPGGLEVPHQNVLVYDRLLPQKSGAPVAEHLLARPEEPVARSTIPQAPAPTAAEKLGLPNAGTGISTKLGASGANPTGTMVELPRGLDALPPIKAEPSLPAEVAALDEGPTSGDGSPVDQAPTMAAPTAAQPVPVSPPEVKEAAPPPPAPTAAPASGDGYRVQLASLRSETDARGEWDRLQRSYPGLLGKLQPQVRRVDVGAGRGTFYRLQAGPLSEKILADMLCGELKQRKVDCIIVQP